MFTRKKSVKFSEKVWFRFGNYSQHWLISMVTHYRQTSAKELEGRLFPEHVQSTIDSNVENTFPKPDENGWCEMKFMDFLHFSAYALEYEAHTVEHHDDFQIMFEGMEVYFVDPR